MTSSALAYEQSKVAEEDRRKRDSADYDRSREEEYKRMSGGR
jgi:hypothetical protein